MAVSGGYGTVLAKCHPGADDAGMSNNNVRFSRKTGLFSPAGAAVERSVPPEVRNLELLSRPIEIISDDYNLGDWQETPSKIIRHDGCYHMWIIDTPLGGRTRPAGTSTTRYLKSRDGMQWLDQGFVPTGAAGSHDDHDRLAPDVVRYDDRFYLFYESQTSNPQRWGGHSRCGIGCIVADDPAGPWRPATDDLLLRPATDAEAFDHAVVTNPQDGVPARQVVHVLQGHGSSTSARRLPGT